jgi:hypothetical protein
VFLTYLVLSVWKLIHIFFPQNCQLAELQVLLKINFVLFFTFIYWWSICIYLLFVCFLIRILIIYLQFCCIFIRWFSWHTFYYACCACNKINTLKRTLSYLECFGISFFLLFIYLFICLFMYLFIYLKKFS